VKSSSQALLHPKLDPKESYAIIIGHVVLLIPANLVTWAGLWTRFHCFVQLPPKFPNGKYPGTAVGAEKDPPCRIPALVTKL
jgi:hypothetical protein